MTDHMNPHYEAKPFPSNYNPKPTEHHFPSTLRKRTPAFIIHRFSLSGIHHMSPDGIIFKEAQIRPDGSGYILWNAMSNTGNMRPPLWEHWEFTAEEIAAGQDDGGRKLNLQDELQATIEHTDEPQR